MMRRRVCVLARKTCRKEEEGEVTKRSGEMHSLSCISPFREWRWRRERKRTQPSPFRLSIGHACPMWPRRRNAGSEPS